MDNTPHRESEEKRLSLGEHLEELRLRIIICVISLIVCFFLCWAFKSQILWVAKRPHSLTMESMGLSATLKVLSYQEGFFAYIKLCLISAFFLSYPMVLYQAWRFVSVGLYRHERHYVKMFLPFSVVGFLLGGLFGYFVLIPLALQFLIRILGPGIEPIITMSQYISLVFLLTLALGLVFQLPLVMLLLNKVGVFTAENYIQWRKLAILGAFILAAMITPTADPFTQTGTALPVMALYEVGILLVRPTRGAFLYAGGLVGVVSLLTLGVYAYLTLPAVGEVQRVVGTVEIFPKVKDNVGAGLKPAPTKFYRGTTLRTGRGSKAQLFLAGGGYIRKGHGIRLYVNESSRLVLPGQRRVELLEGELLVAIEKDSGSFNVNTPSCVVNLENGEIDIKVFGDTVTVTSIKGSAVVAVGEEKKEVHPGHQLRISPGGEAVDAEKMIEWIKGLGKDLGGE
ncbi:MAG TPA: twin-arginine translocase subunit TatC [Candidatus Tripitaka californicus]|uniref:twin-arginine translocase subunit TatC n=1 Tax=Candidatus Tripitaka californicus TaxID=3367616 RepID=UPI004025DE21|nr:twin-arginine translocase subunit TatC [Planctomycetota bacterium]